MSAKASLGTYLRQGRERSGLSVDAISSGSRIVPQLIHALEADRFATRVTPPAETMPLPTFGDPGQVVHATLPDEARP